MKQSALVLLLFATACVDPLSIQVKPAENRLVVDGLITDREGPYQVKLYYSHNLTTTLVGVAFEPAKNATISIIDETDRTYALTEVKPGIYETDPNDLRGEIGKSYHMHIVTADGRKFESTTQQLLSSGEISDVYFKFEQGALPGSPLNQPIDALRVYVNAKGKNDGQNLFRWRWASIFKAKTDPHLRTITTRGGFQLPDPDPCSGYIYQGGMLIRIGPCTCCLCWSYSYSENSVVSKVDLVSDNVFKGLDLGNIPATSMQFYDKYYIEVEQLSLSPEAYDYWNLIEKQQIGKKDIFQPNAIKIRGNMRCLTNPEEEVLGFFGVSGVASSSQFINPDVIPYGLPPINSIHYSCVEYYANSTLIKPWFW